MFKKHIYISIERILEPENVLHRLKIFRGLKFSDLARSWAIKHNRFGMKSHHKFGAQKFVRLESFIPSN